MTTTIYLTSSSGEDNNDPTDTVGIYDDWHGRWVYPMQTDPHRVQAAYREVAQACEIEKSRAEKWAVANDTLLLDRVLKRIDRDTDRILDLGCCGWPWITNYLHTEGYNVVGVDMHDDQWVEHNLVKELGVDLIQYDGQQLPFNLGAFDCVLMFGVLEHVGVWKNDTEKYPEPNARITRDRRTVLQEVNRVLDEDGLLYLTKFPNTYGRDKLLLRLFRGHMGHRNSERARPIYLKNLVGEQFDVTEFFVNGLLPNKVFPEVESHTLPIAYARFNSVLSNTPVLREVGQNYCLLATPR
jgi:SAM-dependent methyltransferase